VTRPRKEAPAGSVAPENPRNTSQKSNRPPRSRRSRTDTRQNSPQAQPALTKYNELLQDIQDETSYFLPVDALSAGTHRYLYHLGDFSAANAVQMQRFLDDKREVLARLEQGKLGNSEHRSALILRPYMDSLSALIGAGYFGDTLWQLRNTRRGLYQLLYMTEIPAYVRGKALVRRSRNCRHLQLRRQSKSSCVQVLTRNWLLRSYTSLTIISSSQKTRPAASMTKRLLQRASSRHAST